MKFLKFIGSKLYKGWMGFAHILMIVNTTLILSIVYIVLIGPTWVVMKIRRKDLLDKRIDAQSTYWRSKEPIRHTIEQSRRQF